MSLPNILTDPPWDFTLTATLPDNTPVEVVHYINALRDYIRGLELRMESILHDLAAGKTITAIVQ